MPCDRDVRPKQSCARVWQSTTGDEYSWAIYITKNYIAIAGSTSEKTPTGTAAKVLAVVQQLVE